MCSWSVSDGHAFWCLKLCHLAGKMLTTSSTDRLNSSACNMCLSLSTCFIGSLGMISHMFLGETVQTFQFSELLFWKGGSYLWVEYRESEKVTSIISCEYTVQWLFKLSRWSITPLHALTTTCKGPATLFAERYVEPTQGIDPTILAAQLEDIKERMSPGASPTSSQPEMYVTPSMSTPVSSPPSEAHSPSTEMPPAPHSKVSPPLSIVTSFPMMQHQFLSTIFVFSISCYVILMLIVPW